MTLVDSTSAAVALHAASRDLLAYFVRRVPSPEDAADLYGEVMLTAWEKVKAMPDSYERQRMWLFVIAAHKLSNHRRTAWRRRDLTDRLREHLATTTPSDEDAHAVRDAVHRLPESQRELVKLIHWDGFAITEAAEILKLNASTARSRYAAARGALRDALVDENA